MANPLLDHQYSKEGWEGGYLDERQYRREGVGQGGVFNPLLDHQYCTVRRDGTGATWMRGNTEERGWGRGGGGGVQTSVGPPIQQ